MPSLLYPAGLAALAGLLVPLILHWWRRPAREVRLGSIRFLDTLARPRLRQLRWRQRWLLLVRLALVAVLAAVLALPQWTRAPASAPDHREFLLPGTSLSGAALAQWQQLAHAGFDRRELAPRFPAAAPDANAPATKAMAHPLVDIWSLLRDADARAAAGSEFVVFGNAAIPELRGTRPHLAHATVRWVPVDIETSDAKRVTVLAATRPDAASATNILFAASSTNGTQQVRASLGAGKSQVDLPDAVIEANSAHDAVRVRSPSIGQWVSVQKEKALVVEIYSDAPRRAAADQLATALRAAGVVRRRAVRININPSHDTTADWIFQLGKAGPATDTLTEAAGRGASVVLEATDAGRSAPPDDALQSPLEAGEKAVNISRVRLLRRVPSTDATGAAWWVDRFGKPILQVRNVGAGRWFTFQSRLDPAWIAWTPPSAEAAWWGALVFGPESDELGAADLRVADAAQAVPASEPHGAGVTLPRVTSLSGAAWGLALVLFILERILSHGSLSVAPSTRAI